MNINDLLQHAPVNHLSFSAIRQYIEDPRKFRKNYIDCEWDTKKALPLTEGSAYHAALEEYWTLMRDVKRMTAKKKEELLEKMKETAMWSLQKMDAETDWPEKRIAAKDVETYQAMGCEIIDKPGVTKTGKANVTYYAKWNVQASYNDLARYLEHYVEVIEREEPLIVEDALVQLTTDPETGEPHLIPLKCRIDLVVNNKDGVVVSRDHKLLGQKPQTDEDDIPIATPTMVMQAACYESILEQTDIGRPDHFTFDVMVKNKTPEWHRVKVELTDVDRLAWSRLFKGAYMKMMLSGAFIDPSLMYTPNPFSGFDSDGWDAYMLDMAYLAHTGEERKVESGEEEIEEIKPYEL